MNNLREVGGVPVYVRRFNPPNDAKRALLCVQLSKHGSRSRGFLYLLWKLHREPDEFEGFDYVWTLVDIFNERDDAIEYAVNYAADPP